MLINHSVLKRGISVKHNNKAFRLLYPPKIWESYPKKMKEVLVDNLLHLATLNIASVSNEKELVYKTSLPLFYSFFQKMVIGGIPHSIDDYNVSTQRAIKKFLNVKYRFKDENVKMPSYSSKLNEEAVIPLSCGKDSLLTLAVCSELGLNPKGIYINDTVSPTENNLKIKHGKLISKEMKIPYFIIRNELENLNDFEYWGTDETCVNYTHMLTNFCFVALPFTHFFKSKYIAVGNQQDMNFPFVNKDGYATWPSFDQTKLWMKQQDSMMKIMTNNQGNVISVIEPITNIAITKILNTRYKEFAKYQISCDCLNASREPRWCHACNKCARLFLFMKAFDLKPNTVGYRRNLFNKKYKRLYSLFNDQDAYEKSTEAKEQQMLAFYLAYKNGVKGELVDYFKRKFLKESIEKEDYLIKKYLGIYPTENMPRKMFNKVRSIYREELA